MVGVHVVSHLARRGVEALSASQDQFHIEQLKKAARLYEDTPGAEIKPVEMLPMLVTALLFLALFVSVCLKSKQLSKRVLTMSSGSLHPWRGRFNPCHD